MTVPTSPTSGVKAPLNIPMYLGKQPGAPSPKQPRQLGHQANCDTPRPTFVLVPGNAASQLDATQDGSAGGCAPFTSPRMVYPDPSWAKNLKCLLHTLSVTYDSSSGRYSNSSGTQLYSSEGGWPNGTSTFVLQIGYAGLWHHLGSSYGYQAGVDMFAAPYDWRLDYDGLDQAGQFDQVAARISAAVKLNCGQKAVILAHSMGSNVVLHMLRQQRFQQWRERNIRAVIFAGASIEGIAAMGWMIQLTGTLDASPALTSYIPSPALAQLPPTVLDQAIYQVVQNTPFANLVLPVVGAIDEGHVLVSTPSRNYSVGQQKELLQDMGSEVLAALFDKVQLHTQQLVDAGPVPGIQSFCLYSTSVRTPMTLHFSADIPRHRAMKRPARVTWGAGDGYIDLQTLRRCSKIVQAGNVVEVAHPLVDHAGLIREPAGLAAIDSILAEIGLVKHNPKGPRGVHG
uniref:Uncharacterized protein n=1 Tax=Tetradesmus obliquus TaxID=3088 RepID=A0A383VUA1_TETOB|eukprot:jgi/Sobl393_1/14385/SZX69077.1